MRPPLSWPMMKDGPGIGAHVDLPRHHLLHGEVAGRHREVLGLEAALLQVARLHQVVGRHAPDVGLVALADGDVGRRCGRDAARPAVSAVAPVAASTCRRFMCIELDRHVVILPVSFRIWHGSVTPAASRIPDCSRNVVHRLCDDLSQSCGRRGFRQRAALLDQVAVFRRRHDRDDMLVEPIEDRLRRALGRADAEEAVAHVVDALLLERRHIGQCP